MCALEGEAVRLQRVITIHGEEMSHASRINEDMNASWNQLSDANASLRAQLLRVDVSRSLEQQDASMRSLEDAGLRVELAASLARELALGNELQTTRFEVQQFVSEN